MRNRRPILTGLLLGSLTLGLAACGTGDEPSDPTDDNNATTAAGDGSTAGSDEQITLTVATFNEFGYEELIEQYMADNPNVTVEHKKAATMDEARQNLVTGLAAGDGLSDIEAAEVGWFAELLQYDDKFVDLSGSDVEGRWLDCKSEAATTADGKLLG